MSAFPSTSLHSDQLERGTGHRQRGHWYCLCVTALYIRAVYVSLYFTFWEYMLGLTVGGSKGHGAAAVSLLPSYQIHPTPCTLKYDTKFVLKKMMAISFLIARPVAKELGVKILVNTLEQGNDAVT